MAISRRQKAGITGVSELRKLLRNAAKHDGRLVQSLKRVIDEQAEEIEFTMKKLAPRDEGDLVSSITRVTRSDGLSVVIGPGVRGATIAHKRTGHYRGTEQIGKSGKKVTFSNSTNFDRFQYDKALWLERGTKKMGRKRFVAPTISIMSGRTVSAVRNEVNRTLTKLKGLRHG